MRPSEASALRWGNVDLKRGLLHVRESFHRGAYAPPKTRPARRTVELHPETVRVLRVLQPADVTSKTPVFVNLDGRPIEPDVITKHWHKALRALKIRQRGIYCCKDTFVTLTLADGRDDTLSWLVQQTGVALETLRRHYAKWIPKPDRGMYERLDPSLKTKRRLVAAS